MPVGWLFADLLLALAMIFLIANTISPKLPPKRPVVHTKPTPRIKPTPTISRSLILDPGKAFRLTTMGSNPDDLAAGTAGAITYIEQQIRQELTQQGKGNRRAGIAIVYGGAGDGSTASIDRALTIASEVYKVLGLLGQQKFVFCHTDFYDPLFVDHQDPGTVQIDIFFFSESVGGC